MRPSLPLIGRLLRTWYRSGLRGCTRATLLLAGRVRSLQSVPIAIDDWPPVFVDLRLLNSHFWLIGTPFARSPIESDEQSVMCRFVRPGDVVFDIGANFGIHTVLLAQLAGPQGRVIAFEPNPDLLATLAVTVAGLGNATLHPYALSDEESEAAFYVPRDIAMGSLADWTSRETMTDVRRRLALGKARATVVQQQRLDGLRGRGLLPRPDFIKCDAEGAELKIFQGAREVLDRADAPIVLFEAGPDTAAGFDLRMSDAASYLVALPTPGYGLYEIAGGGALRPVVPSELESRNQNVLAVPRLRMGIAC